MPRQPRPHPSTLVESWPDAAVGDVAGEVARQVALALKEVMNGRSSREVGRICGVDFTTVNAILNGTTWPDLRTVALLEAGLGADLWPAGVARERGRTQE